MSDPWVGRTPFDRMMDDIAAASSVREIDHLRAEVRRDFAGLTAPNDDARTALQRLEFELQRELTRAELPLEGAMLKRVHLGCGHAGSDLCEFGVTVRGGDLVDELEVRASKHPRDSPASGARAGGTGQIPGIAHPSK